jgi:predicted AAA+ superfamily ATPase
MGVKKLLKPLDDVFDESLDQVIAPSLGKIYGYMKGLEKPESKLDEYIYDLYGKSRKFFSITYITSGMEKVFNEVIEALENGSKGPIILPSLFGGGKTHLLLALLHAFQDPEAILFAEPKDTAEKLYKNLKNLLQSKKIDKIDIVVIDGDYEKYAPSPIKPLNVGPYTVYTIWGYVAHSLGRYDIVRDYDEKQATPSKDALENLFRDKHALILMDEVLSGYAVNLDNTQRGKLLEFFKRLASALQGKNIATVITIPAYYREQTGGIETEGLYKDIDDFIEGFFDAVREQGVIVPPVRYAEEYGGSDVVKILRKRIFGKAEISVPADKISDIISHYQGVYSLGMFPSTARQIELLNEYYPFHPTYIDILIRHIAERRPTTFQRTRFAILITRKVIRNLWQSNRDPDFIHAWSIDLENGDISAAILGKLQEKSYKDYVDKLYEVTKKFVNEEENLAKDIITTIFLRTFLYEGASEATKAYPTVNEVYWAVYDREHNVEPARLELVLDKLIEDPDASYIVKGDDKVYFTTLVDIGEILKKRVEEALKSYKNKVVEKLKDELKEVLVSNDEPHEPFSKDYTTFMTSVDLHAGFKPEDSPEHKAIVYLGQLEDSQQAHNLILGYKNYRNVVVVLDSSDNKGFEELLEAAAWLYVIDNIIKKNELVEMYPDENIRELNEKKLKDIRKKKLNDLKNLATKVLNRVWYPKEEDVSYTQVTVSKKSLLGNIRDALIGEKILDPDQVDLKVFLEKLGSAGKKLDQWTQVSTITDLFLRNPRLWIASKDDVLKVLKRLYDGLEIMIMREGKIYWKNICEETRSEECPGGSDPAIESLKDNDAIARSDIMFEEFVKQLISSEGVESQADKTVTKQYLVQIGGSKNRLRDLYKEWGKDRLYQVLKDPRNKLTLKVEVVERGFILELDKEYKETSPGQPVEVKVSVKPIGDYKGIVRLEADTGTIERSEGVPPFDARWTLTSPQREDVYKYEIRASDGKFLRNATLKINVIGEYETIDVDLSEYAAAPGDVIDEVYDIKMPQHVLDIKERMLQWLGTIVVYLEASGLEGKLKVNIDGLSFDDVGELIKGLTQLKGVSVEAKLKVQDPKPIDEPRASLINSIRGRFKGVKIKAKRKVKTGV